MPVAWIPEFPVVDGTNFTTHTQNYQFFRPKEPDSKLSQQHTECHDRCCSRQVTPTFTGPAQQRQCNRLTNSSQVNHYNPGYHTDFSSDRAKRKAQYLQTTTGGYAHTDHGIETTKEQLNDTLQNQINSLGEVASSVANEKKSMLYN